MLPRYSDKSDGAAVRGKGRTSVLSRVRRQPQGRRRANQLDVDIKVVLLLSVPGKSHLIAVRGKARGVLNTCIAGERDHFGRRCRFSGSPAKELGGEGYHQDNQCSCRP